LYVQYSCSVYEPEYLEILPFVTTCRVHCA